MRYFNDHEPYAAAWLRNLYPEAEVDERDIAELRAGELRGYERVHLFAGIGGWERALDLAGWTGEVWTGSCPCQPFSTAGKRKAEADERHLWPEFRRLVAECRPATIFGEQVASKLGRRWLAGVRADLEALGYRFGAADLCAASAGAPHIRQRLFWVADAIGERGCSGITGREDASDVRQSGEAGFWDAYDILPMLDGKARRIRPGSFPLAHGVPGRVAKLRAIGNAIVQPVAAAFIRAYMEESMTKRDGA